MEGLINGLPCQHSRQECWEVVAGEEWWVCMDCGEKNFFYADSNGGG